MSIHWANLSKMDNWWWKPIHVRNSGIQITRLTIADDIIMFVNASSKEIAKVHKAINLSKEATGQRINKTKSQIIFSPKVYLSFILETCNKLVIHKASYDFIYFVMPMPLRHKNDMLSNT